VVLHQVEEVAHLEALADRRQEEEEDLLVVEVALAPFLEALVDLEEVEEHLEALVGRREAEEDLLVVLAVQEPFQAA